MVMMMVMVMLLLAMACCSCLEYEHLRENLQIPSQKQSDQGICRVDELLTLLRLLLMVMTGMMMMVMIMVIVMTTKVVVMGIMILTASMKRVLRYFHSYCCRLESLPGIERTSAAVQRAEMSIQYIGVYL